MSGNVTQLLASWNAGDASALEKLTPIVYDELRRLGRHVFRSNRPDAVFQPTVLVHEAFLKLADKKEVAAGSRAQFYALAAKVMREILLDQCRREAAAKRGGTLVSLPLQESTSATAPAKQSADMLALDAALRRLTAIKPRYTEIVELRFFAGLTIDECADVLSVSHATIEREWTFARSWLRRELS